MTTEIIRNSPDLLIICGIPVFVHSGRQRSSVGDNIGLALSEKDELHPGVGTSGSSPHISPNRVHQGADFERIVLGNRLFSNPQGAPMQTECSPELFDFPPVEGRRVVAAFDGGSI